jgi:hypothetical protein
MNFKRKLLTSILLSTLIGVGAGAASAADQSQMVKLGLFGSPGQGKSDVTLKVSGTTKFVSVAHFATAKIENGKGQSFVWQFDGAMSGTSFPLKTIAPSGFDAGITYVNVTHPQSHLAP